MFCKCKLKSWTAVLKSDKIDFIAKAVKRDKKRTIHNNKGIYATREYNFYEHLYIGIKQLLT